jgi:phage baseplate assembly protein W
MGALGFPFRFDARGRTAEADDSDHVRDMIRLVLFTSPGERVNRPDFGCGLKQLVFAPASDALVAATQQLVHGALLQWLNVVIQIEKVDVTLDDAAITVMVTYSRRDTGERREDSFSRALAAP